VAEHAEHARENPLVRVAMAAYASNETRGGARGARQDAGPSAPHGFGTPPATYVRHGSQSVPLSMRELQSMFFERRTRLERIESRRREFSNAAQELWARRSAGRLAKISGEGGFALALHVINFRCSLVPTDDFRMDNFPDWFLALKNSQSPKPAIPGPTNIIEVPELTLHWLRRYRAVEHIGNVGDRRYWCASFGADGSINQVSIVAATGAGVAVQVTLAWYSKAILQGMVLAEWFRRWAARPDVEYTLDGEFRNDGAYIVTNADEKTEVSWSHATVGPYSVGSRATFQNTFDVIERELWDAFGLRRLTPLSFDLDEVFRSIGL
jgi:hypothetical protein